MTDNAAETCPSLDQRRLQGGGGFQLTVLLNLVQLANVSEVYSDTLKGGKMLAKLKMRTRTGYVKVLSRTLTNF